METASNTNWLTALGQSNPELEAKITARISELKSQNSFTSQDERNIQKRTLALIQEGLSPSGKELDLLRQLCLLYHVDLIPPNITSHRPVIGPVIVFAKKLVYRMFRPLLANTLNKQRNFNAGVVYLMAEILKNKDSKNTEN